MSPAGGRIPHRLFRGSDMGQEVQLENVRKAFSAIGSANVLPSGIMPIGTTAATGTAVLTGGGNIAWSFMSMSFTSSTTTQASTFSHGLGRRPEAFLNAFSNPFQLAFAPVSTGQWNSTQVIFALASDTVSNVFKVLLI